MSQGGYLAIAIGLIVVLAAVFAVSFAMYRKTPVPKGCEDLVANKEKCEGCEQASCPFYEALNRTEGK
ncbi:MAG: hypothetical protein K6F32_07440 [Bacilli bacterium]|nr:hypothetical protein [Bacilli bacterium]